MKAQASVTIDRPAEVVFQFVAVQHVRNHPRWDHQMELEQVTPGPVGVGTVIRRRHTRAGAPINGSMECVEFDPPRAIAFQIADGPVLMHGRQAIEPINEAASRLTISVAIPGVPNPLDPMPIQRSADRIKELIESEY